MARTTLPLTDTQIRSARPRDTDFTLMDGNGLFLLIRPSGVKKWRLRYYHPNTGKRKLLGIGAYPAMSLAMARKRRDEALRLLADRTDPHAHWQTQADAQKALHAHTFETVALEWLEQKRHEVKARTANEIQALLERNLFPALGRIPVRAIKASTIIECLKPIEARGALETVRRCCMRIREVLDFAANRDLIDANPASSIHRTFKKPRKQNHPSVPPNELPDVMTAMLNARASTSVYQCFLWSLCTIARPSEASSLQWADVDENGKTVTIPAERMKRARDHIIPLTPQMSRILEKMRPISGHCPYVFNSPRHPQRPINPQSVNAVLKRNGFKGRLVSHGLRAIASTYLHENCKFDSRIIEFCLAHITDSESKMAYFRGHYLDQRRVIMQQWNDYLDEALESALSDFINC